MSRRKRLRYCAPTGLPAKVPVRSVKISVLAGGEVKSFRLAVQLSPPWQLEQLAEMKSERPARISAAEAALGKPATGAFGVRTALRTHSRKAVKRSEERRVGKE